MLDTMFLNLLHTFLIFLHMMTGAMVVVSGTIALFLKKGSLLHKLAGRLFVCSMISMLPIVALSASVKPENISSLGFLFVFFITYLVVSAWVTIHRSKLEIGLMDVLAPIFAFHICVAGLFMGVKALFETSGIASETPTEAFFFFSAFAAFAMALDLNNLRMNGVRGKHRIIRHVWRMCCGLFFAVSSLFTGPGSVVFPESIRTNPLLSVPEIVVVLISVFWVCRLFFIKQTDLSSGLNKDS